MYFRIKVAVGKVMWLHGYKIYLFFVVSLVRQSTGSGIKTALQFLFEDLLAIYETAACLQVKAKKCAACVS